MRNVVELMTPEWSKLRKKYVLCDLFIDSFLMLLVKHLMLTIPPWASKHCRWSGI